MLAPKKSPKLMKSVLKNRVCPRQVREVCSAVPRIMSEGDVAEVPMLMVRPWRVTGLSEVGREIVRAEPRGLIVEVVKEVRETEAMEMPPGKETGVRRLPTVIVGDVAPIVRVVEESMVTAGVICRLEVPRKRAVPGEILTSEGRRLWEVPTELIVVCPADPRVIVDGRAAPVPIDTDLPSKLAPLVEVGRPMATAPPRAFMVVRFRVLDRRELQDTVPVV